MHQEEGSIYSLDIINNGPSCQNGDQTLPLSVRTPDCLPYVLTVFFSSIIAVQRSWNVFAMHSYPPTYKELITLAIMASGLFFLFFSLGKLFFKNRK
jgi:hypothetical protein